MNDLALDAPSDSPVPWCHHSLLSRKSCLHPHLGGTSRRNATLQRGLAPDALYARDLLYGQIYCSVHLISGRPGTRCPCTALTPCPAAYETCCLPSSLPTTAQREVSSSCTSNHLIEACWKLRSSQSMDSCSSNGPMFHPPSPCRSQPHDVCWFYGLLPNNDSN